MTYIPQHALENLKKYQYKGVDRSLLSRYVLNPYWNWLVTLWPTWIAPNTITMSGLIMVIINFATLLYFDPVYQGGDGLYGPPHWVYFTWAAGLFIYQSFDAIDGKQARRTGMAGPLGEMFDHGCDALNTTLEAMLTCYAMNLGRSWWTVSSQILALANFYLTTWEEYHTGQLYLGVLSGPVEGIILIVVLFIVTGIKGPAFWDTPFLTLLGLDKVPMIANLVPNVGLNIAFMTYGAVFLLFNIVTSYINVLRTKLSNNEAPLRPLFHLLPFPLTVVLQILWLSAPTYSESRIIDSALLVPFLLAWGLQAAHLVSRIILAHVTKQSFPLFDSLFLWSVVGAIDANMPLLFNREPLIQHNMHNTRVIVYLTLAVSFFSYARFCTLVINDITNYLGIACFTVRKKDATGHWRRAASIDKMNVGKKQ
ncbi:Choline/ethanolaminephosphotransferase [Irpex rosettiformis]|uniref:Choline/ethanolaminephosphotransferase n=1 Tax=Irpex rosettiformis TaxID=378272 RepID=A0ACB8ULK7_9APHY|nr:Choline/ethanolaminephosphotransferase [Irpex rosettiformis]